MAEVNGDGTGGGLGRGYEASKEAVNHRSQRLTDGADVVLLEGPTTSVIAWSGQETYEQQQREVRSEDWGVVPVIAVKVGVQESGVVDRASFAIVCAADPVEQRGC
jgi:hypothetical protein